MFNGRMVVAGELVGKGVEASQSGCISCPAVLRTANPSNTSQKHHDLSYFFSHMRLKGRHNKLTSSDVGSHVSAVLLNAAESKPFK
jgi:hypothetical protein